MQAISMMQQHGGGNSCIPGVSMMDVMTVDVGLAMHSSHKLRDPALAQRVAYWKAQSAADLKTACDTHKVAKTGNKSVLSLRLALKDLPAVVPVATPAVLADAPAPCSRRCAAAAPPSTRPAPAPPAAGSRRGPWPRTTCRSAGGRPAGRRGST